MRSLRIVAIIAIGVLGLGAGAFGSEKTPPRQRSGFVTTSDGVKIHYVESGKAVQGASAEVGNPLPNGTKSTKGNIAVYAAKAAPAILFVPGWTMPEWIWQKQIDYFSRDYRVVAMDPRSQGESSPTSEGLYPAIRARDIKAVVDQLHLAPVVIVAWSMAVVETLAYVDQYGTRDLAGVVLVDSSASFLPDGGVENALGLMKGILEDRQNVTNGFVRNLNFKKPQPEEYIQKVIQASLRVPTSDAAALLLGYFTADYRATLSKIDKPALICAAKSPNNGSIVAMQNKIPGAQLEIFDGDGHALFVDDPDKFNAVLEDFLHDLK
jgi:non-heme chloroperoxidase